ncbi:hypothetical protein C8J57DRAFT_1253487 [Mycena rebaudengoi]|nr:hypothetical protein C8J57DRAFT_1253487 [Mycena rebaudengoi]
MNQASALHCLPLSLHQCSRKEVGTFARKTSDTMRSKACSAGIPQERRKWIVAKSAARHLTTAPHLQAVGRARDGCQRAERLEKEREADSATDEFREIQFAAQHFDGPIASASSRVMSEAEAEMWEEYRINGAEFSAGDDLESPEAHRRQLRQEAESFEVVEGEEDDEDEDFLAEIMRSVVGGESQVQDVLMWAVAAPGMTSYFIFSISRQIEISGFLSFSITASQGWSV